MAKKTAARGIGKRKKLVHLLITQSRLKRYRAAHGYMYFFPPWIRLEVGKRVKCPPHPFQLDAFRRWSIADYVEYNRNAIQIHSAANLKLTITQVHDSHFTSTEAEDRVRELKEQFHSVTHSIGFRPANQLSMTVSSHFWLAWCSEPSLVKTLETKANIDQTRATSERLRSTRALSQQLYEMVVTKPSTLWNNGSSRLAIMG